jgi:hypothetical protein
LKAAAQHRVLHAVFDRLVAEADGLTARRAGRGGGDDPAGDAEHLRNVHRRRMDHGLEVIDGADGAKLGLGSAEKCFIDLPLDGGAAVGGAEGHAQAAGGYKFRRKAGLIENLFGHLTGVIRHGTHGLTIGWTLRPFMARFSIALLAGLQPLVEITLNIHPDPACNRSISRSIRM